MLCLYTRQMILYDTPVTTYLSRMLTVPEESYIKQAIDILKVKIELFVIGVDQSSCVKKDEELLAENF